MEARRSIMGPGFSFEVLAFGFCIFKTCGYKQSLSSGWSNRSCYSCYCSASPPALRKHGREIKFSHVAVFWPHLQPSRYRNKTFFFLKFFLFQSSVSLRNVITSSLLLYPTAWSRAMTISFLALHTNETVCISCTQNLPITSSDDIVPALVTDAPLNSSLAA